MRINLELNDELVEQALAITEIKNKQELINFALAELVKLRSHNGDATPSPKNLLDLAGKIEFTEGFNTDVLR